MMVQGLPYLRETPSQTAGPFVHIGLAPEAAGLVRPLALGSPIVAGPAAPGERIRIEGHVLDGGGDPTRDALIELWQADHRGRHPGPIEIGETRRDGGFVGWGRAVTNFETGIFAFETIKPGRVGGRPGQPPMAPHASLWIAARGINMGLHTRLYFEDEHEANGDDPVLALIEPSRRRTLIAARQSNGGAVVYRFDIHLQGESETVFFDV